MSGFSVGFGAPDPALGNPLRKRNPYVSDDPSDGITGQGPLYDNPDNRETGDFGHGLMRSPPSSVNVYGTAPTTGYSSDTFNDVPTERSATPPSLTIPTRQNLNPPSDYSYSETGLPQGAHEPQTTSAGRIVPNSVNPNEDDTSPNYGDPRSLSRRAYDEYAAARTDPSLKPHASIGRQILGNVIDRFGGGMLHPLADVARYGVHHTQDMQTAEDDLGAAKDIWGAAAKEQGLEQTDRYHQELVAQRMANAQTRQDALNARTFGQGVNQAIAGQNMAEKSFAEPLPAEIQQPAKQFTMPGRNDAADVAAGSDMPPALTLPSRITSPGMTVQGHTPDYRVAQIPSMPTWGGAGDKVVANPPTAVQIPPRDVQLQKAQQAKEIDWPSIPAAMAQKFGIPEMADRKYPPAQFEALLKLAQGTGAENMTESKAIWKQSGGDINKYLAGMRGQAASKAVQVYMGREGASNYMMPGGATGSGAVASGTAVPARPGGPLPGAQDPNAPKKYTIDDVPLEARGMVAAVIKGARPMPPMSRNSPISKAVNAWVPLIDPGYTSQRKDTIDNFTNKDDSKNLLAADTLVRHMGTLHKLIEILDNPDIRAYGKIRNVVETELGKHNLTDVNAALTAVSSELEKAFKGSNPSEQGIQMWRKNVGSNIASKEQALSALNIYGELLSGRVGEMDEKLRRGTGGYKPFLLMSPGARKNLADMGISSEGWEKPVSGDLLKTGPGLYELPPASGNIIKSGEGQKPVVKVQESPSNPGMYRYSTDGGTTWHPGKPTQ